jgi:polyhydroxybutyrate depolymerase
MMASFEYAQHHRSYVFALPMNFGKLWLLSVLGIVLGFGIPLQGAGERATDRTVPAWKNGTNRLVVDGRERTFLLDLPTRLKPGAALVLVFHGFTGSAADVRHRTGFVPLVEREGFVAAYPQGTLDSKGRSFFNVGYEMHQNEKVDDVQFVRTLVARLIQDIGLDARSVFATGFSNGGDMSFFLGSQKEPFLAAIAPVAGTMMASWAHGFRPAVRTSVLAVNVLDDATTRWSGDMQNLDHWGAYLGTEAVLDLWVKGLTLERSERVGIRGDVLLRRWTTAVDDSEVRLYRIEKGGHHWPHDLGNEKVSTAEQIWQFFAAHRH